jgi:RNA polymerase sigma-70 factor, ECF subfamily
MEQQPEIDAGTVTVLLKQLQEQESLAGDRLIVAVFSELRSLAENYLRRESSGHTLQPTALVHEAYLRMVSGQARDWQNRAHFIGVAASVMRRLLIDHARKKRAEKRQLPSPKEWRTGMTTQEAEHLLDLNLALSSLEKLNARSAQIVELRYFGGLSVEETAEVMQISPITVKRQWTAARAWLREQMHPEEKPRQ